MKCRTRATSRRSNATPVMPYWRMVTYKVTATGPQGYQVIAIGPEWQGVVVADFCSLQAAEKFAGSMLKIDAGVHGVSNKT